MADENNPANNRGPAPAAANNDDRRADQLPVPGDDGLYDPVDWTIPDRSDDTAAYYPYRRGMGKPTVRVGTTQTKYTPLDVLGHITNAPVVSKDLILHFLWSFMEKTNAREQSGWASYGIPIAEAGTDVKPSDLLDKVDAGEFSVDATTASGHESVAEQSIFGMCLAMVRISSIHQQEHRDRILSKFEQDYAALGISDTKKILKAQKWHTLTSSHDYMAIAAAVDMFLYRFPLASGSYIRMGTVVTRGAQLTALSSLSLLCPTRSEIYVLASWCSTPTLKGELKRLLKGGQEMDQPGSYFHYQVSMGLSARSCYSASENPYLFIFIHTAGSLLASERSMKAFFPKSIQNYLEVFKLAIAFSYERALIGQFDPSGGLYFRGVEYQEEDALQLEEGVGRLKGCKYWMSCIKSGNQEWRTALGWAQKVVVAWDDPFEGTFGHRVKEIFTTVHATLAAADNNVAFSAEDFME